MTKKIMRSILLTSCLVMIFSHYALALSVVDSKHNLSSTTSSGQQSQFKGISYINGNQITEVCVFCHTPHGASPDAGGNGLGSMLWNRVGTQSTRGSGVYTPYSSSTFSYNNPSWAPTGLSLMCMSCHDGITAIAVGTLLNPPGSGQPIVTTSGLRSLGDLYYLTNNWIPSNAYPGNPNLGGDTGPVGALDPSLNPYSGYAVDLSNDHPVSFAWPTDAILLGGLNPVAGIDKKLRLFGIGNRIECSTCHNVHNNAIPPFLAVSNDNSYMCLQCHNK